MCCEYNEKFTEKIKQELLSGNKVFWKIFKITDDETPRISSVFREGNILKRGGWLISDRVNLELNFIRHLRDAFEPTPYQDSTEGEGKINYINSGIHVFLNKKDAEYVIYALVCLTMFNKFILVPVSVKEKDFVGAGLAAIFSFEDNVNEAVFMKACIDKNSLFNALKEKLDCQVATEIVNNMEWPDLEKELVLD